MIDMQYNVSAPPDLLVAVGLELPYEVAREVAAFRAKYDPSYVRNLSNGGAHITLKRPDKALCSIDEIVARLRQMVKGITAPRLLAGGITVYHSLDSTTIYLRVLPNQALLDLHTLLHNGLRDCLTMQANFEGKFFVPHITLANWLSDRELGKVMSDLSGLVGFWKEFYCTELSLAFCQNNSGLPRWERARSFYLKP